MSMKLQHWMVDIAFLPGEENTLANALSGKEKRSETVSEDGLQSGAGGCGGAPSTEEEISMTGSRKGRMPEKEERKRQRNI